MFSAFNVVASCGSSRRAHITVLPPNHDSVNLPPSTYMHIRVTSALYHRYRVGKKWETKRSQHLLVSFRFVRSHPCTWFRARCPRTRWHINYRICATTVSPRCSLSITKICARGFSILFQWQLENFVPDRERSLSTRHEFPYKTKGKNDTSVWGQKQRFRRMDQRYIASNNHVVSNNRSTQLVDRNLKIVFLVLSFW